MLSNYIGKWDFVYTSENPPLSKGEFNGRWILGGRFLERVADLTAERVPNDISLKVVMTYDSKEKTYRKWTFISNGRILAASGTWDERNRTMTWVSNYDEEQSGTTTTFTTTETFIKEGVQEWTTLAKSPNDPVGDRSSGTSIRRQR